MPIPFPFDWRKPDYRAVWEWRVERLASIRSQPDKIPALKMYYRDHPAQFMIDWGVTFDPRNPERDLPSTIPFLLFPKQEEWVEWFMDRWRNREDGITEKTRDMGVSWLTMGLACTTCVLRDEITVGCGSRKEEYVDVIGDPDSLFEKARIFMSGLPVEFRAGWTRDQHATYMKMVFPETGSIMTGEAGDGIGRGGRASFYIVDESAFLTRPELVDRSLSATTNCRQDVSTPNGPANRFAVRRHSGKVKVFTFHWRDDPRKDQDWYETQRNRLDAVTLAQEVDIDYSASVEGVVIPSAWVQAAIDAHLKLNIAPTGSRVGALDVADEGRDKNGFAAGQGILIDVLEEWSGKGGDIFSTVQKAFDLCDQHGLKRFDYDADGLGAGVRGDARVINEGRRDKGIELVAVEPYRGSGAVHDPEGEMVSKRKNKDYFANLKAQAWWALRLRFQQTHRAVVEGKPVPPDSIISLSSKLPLLAKLCSELSQPTYSVNGVGKIVIDKMPDGAASPNLADAAVIKFQPGANALDVWARLAA
jgi:phage terminase large subunit